MHEFNFWHTILTIAVMFGVLQGTCAFLIYVERKIAAYVQDRIGPNRVGPKGLLQSVADGLKFLLKEELIPGQADRALFVLAPCIAIFAAMLGFAVVPFGATEPGAAGYQFIIAPNVDIGIVFIFAISSLTVYAILLGGWAANNKYSFIGGLRSSAQVISYEIPMGLSILGVILISGSLNLERIIWQQAEGGLWSWNIFFQPLAFLIFMISAFAETNRLPFDLPEAEQELVGGYHTEYNAMKLALFFLGEYTHMITTSFLMVILFFGGWHLPFVAETDGYWLIKLIIFAGKMTLLLLFFMLVRWTIPRFRFDQLMGLAWKVMIPLALVNVVCVMVVLEFDQSLWLLLPISLTVVMGAGWIATLAPLKPTVALE